MTAPAYDGTMVDDDVFVLAGRVPNALHLLSEAEDERDWTPDLLAFLPPSLSNSPYTRWLWWELVGAVRLVRVSAAVDREAEVLAGNVRSLLGRLVTGGPICTVCCEQLNLPFEQIITGPCPYRSHQQDVLRLISGCAA